MEDYKKKYEEIVKKIKETKESMGGYTFSSVVDKIIPELKESDDKRIRESLINYVNYHGNAGDFTKQEFIAWLEKQGEQKLIDKIQLGKKYKCIASPRYSTFMIGEIYKPEDKFLCSLMNFCYDCFEPIEDDEQKPDIQHSTEWSVSDFRTWQYIVSDVLTKKDGIGQYLDSGECQKIAKYMQEEWEGKLSKEQTQEELRKGEDYGIDGLYHAARILEKTLGEVDGYQSDDGILEHKCAIETVKRLYKQKPTWNEEDEEMIEGLNNCINELEEENGWNYIYVNDKNVKLCEVRNWLKSLKERIKL